MLLTIILAILALASSGLIYYFGFFVDGLGTTWYSFVISIVSIPVFYYIWMAISLLILLFFSAFINRNKPVDKPNKFANFLVYEVVFQINLVANVRLHKTGLSQIPNGPCLIVYNHTSKFDPMFIMDKLHRKNIICVTKPENLRIPICGPFIYKAGYIPVNREDDKEGMKAILKAIDFIKNYNVSICISPEGTRSKTHELLPFRAGVFNVAKRAEVPIVIIGFKNTYQIAKNFPFKRTHVHMDVLDVLSYDNFKELTTGEISSLVRNYYVDYLSDNNK